MTMVWSSVKEQVFRLERDTLVSAGAGSGKTAALVELYLRLVLGESSLDRPLEPAEIIAITFTDKAAQEMRERIRAGMRSRLASRHASPPRLLEELSSAPIATFHSFCARLLRENTVAAAVDPRFTVLDAFAAGAEREGAMADLLREEFAGEAPELSLVLHHLSLEGGDHEPGLPRLLGMIQEQGDAEPSWYDSATEAAHLGEKEGRLIWDAGLATFQGLMAEVPRILGAKPLVFHKALADLPGLWPLTPVDPLDTGIPGHLARLGACLGGNWGNEKEVRERLLATLESLKEASAQVTATPVLLALLALGRRFGQHYARRKSRRGVLDFEDLQVKARDLLRHAPEVRQALQSSCRVVLVDEFQDTNPLQKEIVSLLCGPEQRLFVVGDPKQSIYLFRGADVTVFNRMGEEMQQRGGDILYFQESFRSRQGIIDLVNDLFGRIMNGGDGDFYTRFGAGDRLEPMRGDWDGSPCAELLTLPGKEKGEEGLRQEADAVAERILSLVDGRGPVQVWRRGPEGSPPVADGPRYGDIAILFRRFSHLKTFEESLRRRSIPYHVVKGRGFYQCQEIMDILSFLRYLDSSCDLVALAGLLRSPLCGVSDDTLYLLSRHDQGIGAWEELLPDGDAPNPLWERIEDDDRQRLTELHRLMARLRPVRDRLTVSELLEEMLSATLFTVTLLALFQGEQKAANVRKLLDLARSFHQRGDGTLRQFIGWLQRLVDQEPTEAEALLSAAGEDAVALMTVHQSKGLEFPVVFIPECGAPLRNRNEPLIVHPQKGLALRLRQAVGESLPTLAHRRFSDLTRRQEMAESQRLFYVAMTRARDYLVLSGESSGRGASWRAWLDDYLAAADTPLLARREVTLQPDPAPTPPAARELSPPTAAEVERAMDRAIRFQPPLPSLVVFSPTALEDFRSCPRKYYYKGVLGLDEGLFAQLLGVRGASPARGTSGLSSLDKGTLAHRILQSLEFGADPGSWRQTAARCVETFPLDVPAADRAEVEQRVTAFASSPLGRSLAGQRLRRELPFLLRLDGAAEYHLTGAMDLVAEGEQSVTVIDYKYAAGAKGAPEGYRFQVGAYMLALSKAYPDREIGGKLVFLGDGEVLPVEVDLPRFEAELVAIMDRIRGLRDEEEFTPLPGCDGASCPFRERCVSLAP